MSLLDIFGFRFGFSFGATATEEAFNAVSDRYRAKDFDPVVRKDLLDIMGKGRLESIAYPFPTKSKKQKKPLFVVRHKIFSISLLLYLIFIMIFAKSKNQSMYILEKVTVVFLLFWLICIAVMTVKYLLRCGKKVSDSYFQTEFIQQGRKYWNIREYVRQALESGALDVQGAYVRIRDTDLGRQLPDSDTELEAKLFNTTRRS